MFRLLYRFLTSLAVLTVRSGRSKDLEPIVLRHQFTVLRRDNDRPAVTEHDRSLLAAIAAALPRRLRQGWIVTPDTLLRWHRRRIARHWTQPARSPGRPSTATVVRRLVIRMAHENPTWGYRRIHGELTRLGHTLAASTVWQILKANNIDPAPHRNSVTWTEFLRSQAAVACDFLTVDTIALRHHYVLFFIDITTRHVIFGGVTANPTGPWTAQAAHNLFLRHSDQLTRTRALVRDRSSQFTNAFDEIFRSSGIKVLRTPVRTPLANAFAERWVGTIRRELLDRTIIWNRHQLELLVVNSSSTTTSTGRTAHSTSSHRPPMVHPNPSGATHWWPDLRVATASSTNTDMPPEQVGPSFRHPHDRVIRSSRCDGFIHEYRHAA